MIPARPRHHALPPARSTEGAAPLARAAASPIVRGALALSFSLLSLARGAWPPAQSADDSPSQPADAVRILLDRTLKETPARIVRIDAKGVWFVDPADPPAVPARLSATADLIGVLSPDPSRALRAGEDGDERARLVVTLVDGQRVVGRAARPAPPTPGAKPNAAPEKDAPLTLDTAVGTVRIVLDRVALVSMTFDAPPAPPKKDTVVLANGDRLEGFIEAIGAEITVQPDGAPTSTIPIDRVREISLANPRSPVSGTRAWLADGTLLVVSDLAQQPGAPPTARVNLLGADTAAVSLPTLASVVFDSSLCTPLARLDPAQVRPTPDRRWTRPPHAVPGPAPLDAPDYEFPGPMTVEWPLPERAVRFAGTAELARFADQWGDCTIIIESGAGTARTKLWSQHLRAAAGAQSFNVDLGPPAPGRTLRLTLEPGASGPIQDRLILRRPLLLLAPNNP